jgi:hypothetical protein
MVTAGIVSGIFSRSGMARWRFSCIIVGLLGMAATSSASAEDWLHGDKEVAQTWAMHKIAVIQAEAGDFNGAKQTVAQITEHIGSTPAVVTGVWFDEGRPVYNHPPAEWPIYGKPWTPACSCSPCAVESCVPTRCCPACCSAKRVVPCRARQNNCDCTSSK